MGPQWGQAISRHTVMTWKLCLYHWPTVRGNHRSSWETVRVLELKNITGIRNNITIFYTRKRRWSTYLSIFILKTIIPTRPCWNIMDQDLIFFRISCFHQSTRSYIYVYVRHLSWITQYVIKWHYQIYHRSSKYIGAPYTKCLYSHSMFYITLFSPSYMHTD